jgi:hypothetical protein
MACVSTFQFAGRLDPCLRRGDKLVPGWIVGWHRQAERAIPKTFGLEAATRINLQGGFLRVPEFAQKPSSLQAEARLALRAAEGYKGVWTLECWGHVIS